MGERSAIEEAIEARCQAGDFEAAATRAIEGYGPELLGYLYAVAPSKTDAEDLYADLCERLWKHLPSFRWQSSLRTWAYAVARNLLRSDLRARRGKRHVTLSDSAAEKLAQSIRSTTAIHLRTESKNKLDEVRAGLDPDERTLLILRVDRKLPWQDVARVFAEGDASSEDLSRLAASLRKRFERVKDKLRREMNAAKDG